MSALGISKPWRALIEPEVAEVPGQLGVYELADATGTVVKIGYAGGREPFGLRSALARELTEARATHFRVELNHAYLTRWQELLMLHVAEYGELPPDNVGEPVALGRLGAR